MDKFNLADPPGQTAFPIARPGYPYIFTGVFVTAVFALLGYTVLTFIFLFLTGFVCWFFRDPDRVIPAKEGAVVSPADGRIIIAKKIESNRFIEGECLKISIFMNVFNVHVNRIPFEGKIKNISYFPGKFLSANLDKASKDNEHNAVVLTTEKGDDICFVQIAGLIARRIICNIQEGARMKRGQRFGMICFGSRLDVYLPAETKIDVAVGDIVSAGTSILGYLP